MLLNTKKFLLLFSLIVNLLLSACSSMPSTQSGFLSDTDYNNAVSLSDKKIDVIWKVDPAQNISDEEQQQLITLLEAGLQQKMIETKSQQHTFDQYNAIKINAAITRVEPVSPLINWITTILVFIPLDHGGAAVEIEAIDTRTNKVITQLSYAQWVPLTELAAHFTRLAPVKIALASAADEFVDQLAR